MKKKLLFIFFILSPTCYKIVKVCLTPRFVLKEINCWPQFNLERMHLLPARVISTQYIALKLSETSQTLRKTFTGEISFTFEIKVTISLRWYKKMQTKNALLNSRKLSE